MYFDPRSRESSSTVVTEVKPAVRSLLCSTPNTTPPFLIMDSAKAENIPPLDDANRTVSFLFQPPYMIGSGRDS